MCICNQISPSNVQRMDPQHQASLSFHSFSCLYGHFLISTYPVPANITSPSSHPYVHKKPYKSTLPHRYNIIESSSHHKTKKKTPDFLPNIPLPSKPLYLYFPNPQPTHTCTHTSPKSKAIVSRIILFPCPFVVGKTPRLHSW